LKITKKAKSAPVTILIVFLKGERNKPLFSPAMLFVHFVGNVQTAVAARIGGQSEPETDILF
jgi:hypothetical protein